MQAAQTIRPALGIVDSGAGAAIKSEVDLILPRYIFSAFWRVDTRFDLCDFDELRPGEITLVDNHRYKIRNIERVTSPEANAEEFVWATRKAAHIVRGLKEGQENLVVLEELTGLDPKNSEDRDLLYDLQATLLPETFTSGYEQLKWLDGVKESEKVKGSQIHLATCERMLQATANSIAWAEMYVSELKLNLSRAAAGKEGYHSQLWREDKRVCDWIEEPHPAIASHLEKGKQPAFDVEAFAQALATANAAQQSQFMTLMQEMMTRMTLQPAGATSEPVLESEPTVSKRNGQRQPLMTAKKDPLTD